VKPCPAVCSLKKNIARQREYPGQFKVGIGAEAISELLAAQDLEALSKELRAEMLSPILRQSVRNLVSGCMLLRPFAIPATNLNGWFWR
jgi:hypothetical protein